MVKARDTKKISEKIDIKGRDRTYESLEDERPSADAVPTSEADEISQRHEECPDAEYPHILGPGPSPKVS